MATNIAKSSPPVLVGEAIVLLVGVEPGALADALVEGVRGFRWLMAQGPTQAVELARRETPDLVIVGGEASGAARLIKALTAEPATAGASFIAWPGDATGREVALLTTLGARVALASPASLLRAMADALGERQRRTLEPTLTPQAGQSVDLAATRVVIADDDPAVVWFLADTLRSAGCEVVEATDGQAALEAAYRTQPHLVMADIRMPRLGGVRLCETLHADPILADLPVVLLSWREDWLPEACRKGGAAAALTKRATPEQVVSCVRAALAPHATLEQSLRQPGGARGPLDAVSPYRVLRAACLRDLGTRVTLRTPTHLYEIRIRDGAPRSARRITTRIASRVASDGGALFGQEALVAALSIHSGTFAVHPDRGPVQAELRGTLHEQIARHVASARGLGLATPLPETHQTIPMRMPGGGEADFELPRASATLVDLPACTVPMAPRRSARDSTFPLVFPPASRLARRVTRKIVARGARPSTGSRLRAAAVVAFVLVSLGLLGGLDASPASLGATASTLREGAARMGLSEPTADSVASPSTRAARTSTARSTPVDRRDRSPTIR